MNTVDRTAPHFTHTEPEEPNWVKGPFYGGRAESRRKVRIHNDQQPKGDPKKRAKRARQRRRKERASATQTR